MSLPPQHVDAYSRDGFLVVENVIAVETLANLRRVIAEMREQANRITQSDDRFDVGPGHSPATPKLRRIKDPVDHHAAFDAVMRSEALLDIIAPLIGSAIRFDHSKLNFKPAGGEAQIEWHQDWAFYPHTNDDLLAVGVMIEDCTFENGPLMVIPGSHRGPVYDHHTDGVFAGGVRPEDLGDEIERALPLTAPAGSISIHHVRTLHASTNNRSDRERPLLLLSYAAVDAFPVFDTRNLAEFDARIVRGASTLAPRMTAAPLRIPLPKSAQDGSIYENQAQLHQRPKMPAHPVVDFLGRRTGLTSAQ